MQHFLDFPYHPSVSITTVIGFFWVLSNDWFNLLLPIIMLSASFAFALIFAKIHPAERFADFGFDLVLCPARGLPPSDLILVSSVQNQT